jgi:hypothetical protein
MATTIEPTPVIPPSYRGEVTAAGVGSGVLVSPVILPPTPPMEPQFRLFNLVGTESARPEREISFGALQDPSLRLLKPIPLEVSVEGTDVILTWAEVDEFGCGDNTSAAIDDFAQSIRELYHHLHSEGVQLGSDLLRVRGILDQYIVRRG